MKKHLFILSAVMLLTSWTAGAATYLGFKVADVSITSDNYNQPITSEYITANVDTLPYSVTYNHSTATLTLKNVKIKRTGSYNRAILNESCNNLIIVFEGHNLLEAIDSSPVRLNANTTIKSPNDGFVLIYGGSEDALTIGNGATLTINDANVNCQNNSNKTYSSGIVGNTGNEKVKIINSYVNSHGNNGGYALKNIASLDLQSSYIDLHGGGGYEGYPVLNLKAFSYSGDQFHLLGDTGYDVVFSPTEKNFMVGSSQQVQTAGVMVAKAIDYLNDRDAFPDVNFAQAISDNTKYYSYWEARVMRRYILLPFHYDTGTGGHYAIIEANEKDISSIKGIEYLTDLEELYLNDNSITTADLSQNTKLKFLHIDNNQLTLLNVSNSPMLRELSCANNRLTSLNLSNCRNICYAHCQNNQIANLQLPTADNYSLNSLQCQNNKIKDFNLYNFKNLTYLDCSHNEIEGNLAVYGIYLDSLNCSFNKITRIDNLINCGHVKTLRCNDNLIERLDLSNMIRLETFDCHNNKLTTLNLKWCSKLSGVVDVYGNNINGSGMDALIANLPALINRGLNFVDHNNANEGNACTAAQVNAASNQGWTIFHRWQSDEFTGTSECLNYDMKIAGVRLHSHLASNLDGSIDGVSGTWRYNDGANMLLLSNATINGGNYAGIETTKSPIVINVSGDNTVTSDASVGMSLSGNINRITGFNATGTHNLTVKGNARGIYVRGANLFLEGGLHLDAESRVYGILGNNSTTVSVSDENTVVRSKGEAGNAMRGVSALYLNDGLVISQPEGTTFTSGVGFVNNGSEVVNQWVTISQPYTEYPLQVAGVQVTNRNADAITGEGITGTVTYSPSDNTLTLTDVTITANTPAIRVGRDLPGIKIVLEGENSINFASNGKIAIDIFNCDGAVIEGPGKLNINNAAAALYIDSGSGTGEHRMTIRNCEINVNDPTTYSPSGTSIQDDMGDANITIENATVHLMRGYISAGYDLKLVNCEIVKPVGGYVDGGNINVAGSGSSYYTGEIEIVPKAGLRGDVTGDGKVDVEDVNAAINIILELKQPSDYSGDADVTGDNKVDIEDVNAIINIILSN